MKLLKYGILVLSILLISGNSYGRDGNKNDNCLTKKEMRSGWKLLFDGKTSEGWMNAGINGQKTLEYERGNQAWRDLVATSKFKNYTGFGEVKYGRILLQEHGDYVTYKNIKIRVIK